MTILKIENLSKNYGKQSVLKNVNLTIETPGIYAIIGPNGSGKTTLFNTISNLIKPTTGKIEVVGLPNTNTDIFYEVSFLKDNRVLYDYLTGYDHLQFIKNVQKLDKSRVDEVIQKLEIESYIHKKVGALSLGMKQKLLIAMAMLNEPKLMILDEPLNGLDPTSVIKIRHMLQEISKEDTAVLISSHTLSEIDLMTDKILFLKDGEIIENKDKSNLKVYTFEFNDSTNLKQLKEVLASQNFEANIENGKLIVKLEADKLSEVLNTINELNLDILDISKKSTSSEELYMKIFLEK